MRRLFALTLLSGCVGWNNLPNQSYADLSAPLWDPSGAIATQDGLYVPLLEAGGLALLDTKGEARLVDVGEGRVRRITAAPGGETLVAFIDRTACDPKDPAEAKHYTTVQDCPSQDRVVSTEISVITQGEVGKALPVDGTYNAIEYASDGGFAIAYLDFNEELQIQGVINLTSVVVLDLNTGENTPVSVGFAADQVLFVEDSDGQASQAVVLSQNEVALLDLTATPPTKTVTYPLTINPDQLVVPVGVDLTPDGRYALISAEGSADLYVLDLQQASINIVELDGAPSAMEVNKGTDQTVLVYNRTASVEVLDHELFDLRTLDVDEPMNQIAPGTDFDLLYSTAGNKDVYRLELPSTEIIEYRLQNAPSDMFLSPTEEFAIALTRPSGGGGLYANNPGMEVIDLRSDNVNPYLLEGEGLGVAFSEGDSSLVALVLQAGVDYLYQLDLYTGQAQELELSEPPVAIGTLPDGTFWITHTSSLGLVSFLDPNSGEVTEAAGFGTLGLMDTLDLVVSEEQ